MIQHPADKNVPSSEPFSYPFSHNDKVVYDGLPFVGYIEQLSPSGAKVRWSDGSSSWHDYRRLVPAQ